MALVYFDSSALVKLLVDESGSEAAAILWDGCDAAISSRLVYPEVCAALAAASRNRDLDEESLVSCERLGRYAPSRSAVWSTRKCALRSLRQAATAIWTRRCPPLVSCERDWEGFWAAIRPVEISERVARAAGRLAKRHHLRGADAVHLASALEIDRSALVVAVWDRRLHTGAVAEHLAVAPATLTG